MAAFHIPRSFLMIGGGFHMVEHSGGQQVLRFAVNSLPAKWGILQLFNCLTLRSQGQNNDWFLASQVGTDYSPNVLL